MSRSAGLIAKRSLGIEGTLFLTPVPEGAADDDTRRSEYYDGTFSYLQNLGLPLI